VEEEEVQEALQVVLEVQVVQVEEDKQEVLHLEQQEQLILVVAVEVQEHLLEMHHLLEEQVVKELLY
jgi:hypothetical protein